MKPEQSRTISERSLSQGATTGVTLSELRELPVIPVWHASKPSAARVFGIGRAQAYEMARRGDFPTIRLGSRIVVPVPRLLAMLGEEAADVPA